MSVLSEYKKVTDQCIGGFCTSYVLFVESMPYECNPAKRRARIVDFCDGGCSPIGLDADDMLVTEEQALRWVAGADQEALNTIVHCRTGMNTDGKRIAVYFTPEL